MKKYNDGRQRIATWAEQVLLWDKVLGAASGAITQDTAEGLRNLGWSRRGAHNSRVNGRKR